MKFLVPIDLAKNELQNAVVHLLADAPGTPAIGQIYYNTGDNRLYYRDNAGWKSVSTTAGTVTSVTATAPLASSGGTTPDISLTGTVSATRGGTGVSDPTVHGIMVAEGASAMSPKVLTDGQLLIGSTGVDPVAAALTGTTKRLGVTLGAGSITLNIDTTQFPQAVIGDVGKVLIATAADTAAWGTLGVTGGGTGRTAITANAFLYGAAANAAMVEIGPLTNGQIIIGKTGDVPLAGTITGTSKRLGVTNAANSITLNIDTTQFPQAVIGDVGKTLVVSAADTAAWGTLGVVGGGTAFVDGCCACE